MTCAMLLTSPVKHWRGKMTDYQLALLNIAATMFTGVIVIGCNGAILFLGLMIWQLIEDRFDL